ncbi:MAG: thioesterase domain-containing protein, partial [Ilumatobacteraceae bacterium]
ALVTTVMPAEFCAELAEMWLHPAVLDNATGSAQALILGFSATDTFFVPFSYELVTCRAPIPVRAISHVRLRDTSAADTAVFDVTICDESGAETVSIEGFTMRRVAPGATLTSTGRPRLNELPVDVALREGILPSEGVDALDRIVAAVLGAQVVASSIDLQQWTAFVDAEERSAVSDVADGAEPSGLRFDRPDIASKYSAPQTPIEREIAEMWSGLLGVETVGRDDDFFELGGQSLIAVRLFTRLRRRYNIDLPLATLFEAPTVAQCAAVVAARIGVVDSESVVDDVVADGSVAMSNASAGRAPASLAAAAGQAFRHLVTIQKGGDLLPFYCVHGSGGNVLNFRDLSLAMGRNQPFYGVQASGIDGVLPPLWTIGEMATAYLDEIRALQPRGPYLLGGYSGGGLVAFEMAHQLSAAGQEVALVVLLDTFPPVVAARRVTLLMRLERLRAERMAYVKNVFVRRLKLARRRRDAARLDAIVARHEVVPSELRELNVERAFMAAAAAYVLRPWSGRVVLMRAEKLHYAFQELGASYGWDEVVQGDFELMCVPGDHDTLVLEPNASRLVHLLRDTLDGALPATR